MSGEKNPLLSGAVPAFEMFMSAWEDLARNHPRLEAWIEGGLQWAKEYYNKFDDTKAYVIAMRE